MDDLKSRFPCRDSQLSTLHNLFCHADEPFPDAVYITGGPSSGKTSLTTTLFEKFKLPHVVVNLIECHHPRILYETILATLCGETRPQTKCDNMMDFIANLRKYGSKKNSIIVIDKAERLRNFDVNIGLGLMRLRELSELPTCVVFISEIVLQKFYPKLGAVSPIKIHFPQYTLEELHEILALDCDFTSMELGFDLTFDFYRNYLNVFLLVFYRVCRDLSELRYMAQSCFLQYCQPIITKDCGPENSMVLWRRMAPQFKQRLQGLYLRINNDIGEDLAGDIELPFYAKYLLIAAYLASYNPAKDDKRLFVKYHGKKTKTMRDIKKKSKVSEQLTTQLGPKAFNFDRLLAIFYSILDDKVGFNNNILVQVSSLVELQLLSCLSDATSLDGPKYKCNVNFDFIQVVSKMVGFNIRKYLSDFSHM